MWRLRFVGALLLVAVVGAPAAAQAPVREVPYWVSLKADEANARTGPDREYPIKWVYRRAHLPMKVVQVRGQWRKVEDHDGDQSWMHVLLVSPNRTAIVIGDPAPMRAAPDSDARVAWRLEPGVVGKIDGCAKGWCAFDVMGRAGYVEASHLWGATQND